MAGHFEPARARLPQAFSPPKAHQAAPGAGVVPGRLARSSRGAWRSAAQPVLLPAAPLRPSRRIAWPGNTYLQMDPRSAPSRLFAARPQILPEGRGAEARGKWRKIPHNQSGSLFILKLRPAAAHTPWAPSARLPLKPRPSSRRGPIPAQLTAHCAAASGAGTCPRVSGDRTPVVRSPGALPRCGARRSPRSGLCPRWVCPLRA